MGKQILIDLSEGDEAALATFLTEKKGAQIIDAHYSKDWDRKSLTQSKDAELWLVLDPRTLNALIANANQGGLLPDSSEQWVVRGLGGAAIEWNRGTVWDREKLIGAPNRLYLATTVNPLGEVVYDLVGKSVESLYRSATVWIKKHCTPLHTNGPTIWRSKFWPTDRS